MDAFLTCPRFKAHVKPGKQAVKGEHRDLLVESARARVSASLDFEAALDNVDLEAKRFDYVLAVADHSAACHAVEVHAFRPTELMDKKRGTLHLLSLHCPNAVGAIKSWQVVLKGTAPRADLAARFQAESKILIAGRNLSIAKL